MTADTRKTAAFVVTALVLSVLAWATTPRRATPSSFQDRGRPFFPEFTDPNAATSLEVVQFDERTFEPQPFKVSNHGGRWTIPSHNDYPADSSNRLSSIAASVIALKKDDTASDNLADQERCGVLDPLDVTLPVTKGRGVRITVKGDNEKILADIIVGKAVEGRPSHRYVRLPDERRTYVARVDNLDISTRFEDWIDRNLLQVDRRDIDQIIIRNYSTDVKSGSVNAREMLALKKSPAGRWTVDRLGPGESIDTFRMNLLVTKLVELEILDVRPKPVGVAATLTAASGQRRFLKADVAELASKGFYFTADGELLSNQGEVVVHTSTGVFYVLRFGEVAFGTPDGRYLFISVGLDPGVVAGDIPDEVRKRLELLRVRFAPWYYLVSNENFKKIRLQRTELIRSGKPAGEP
jgi:hypothetical protein